VKKWFENLIEWIVSTTVTSGVEEYVRLTNKIALIISCVAFPYIFIFRPFSLALSNAVIVIIGAFFLVIVLNKFYYFNIARFLLVFSTNLTAMYYAASFGVGAGIQNLFFAYLVLPLMLFGFRDVKKVAAGCSVSILCILYLELTEYYSPTPVASSVEFQNLIRLTSIFFVSIIIFLSIKSLIVALERMYQDLYESKETLATSTMFNAQLQYQTEKSLAANQRLNLTNEELNATMNELETKNTDLLSEKTAHQQTISELKETNKKNQQLLQENQGFIKRLEWDLQEIKELYDKLKEQTDEKIAALEQAGFERKEKEASLEREREKLRVIQEQQHEIESHQVALAEKEVQDKLLRVSEHTQQRILQTEFPVHDSYKISAYFRPSASISGDYYAVQELDNGCLGFFVADVTGHGTPAALIVTGVSMLMEDLLNEKEFLYSPADVLTHLNQKMFMKRQISKAVACTYCMYDPKTRLLRYARGGAEALLIIRKGEVLRLTGGDGAVLRMFETEPFSQSEEVLEKGDVLLVATDGISDLELKNGKPFIPTIEKKNQPLHYDYRTLKKVFASLPRNESGYDADVIGNSIVATCLKPKDDITIVVLEIF